MLNTPSMNQRRSGFTLIELLVVISIISLLIGILLPALNISKKTANKIVCLSNVRRLGISMRLYLDENNDVFPPDRIRGNYVGTKSIVVGPYERKNPRWIWYLNEGMGFVINPYQYKTEAEFNAALEMDNKYYICPSLKDRDYVRNIRNGAYGYNFQYLSNTRAHPSGHGYANYPNKASRIKRPMTTIIFGDSRGADIPHGEHAYLIDPPKMAVSRGAMHFAPKSKDIGPLKYSPADARHLGKANVVFFDGHAESMNYEELGYEVDPDTKRPVEKKLTEVGGGGNNLLWTGTGFDEPENAEP